MPRVTEVFDYTALPGGGAALARVYGGSPVLALPEALPAPDGRLLPLVKLGGYCFAETVRDAPRGPLLRCVRREDGALRPVEAGGLPPEALHPVAGRFLEEIALPAALREMDSCAFYNCRALRRMAAWGGPLAVGSDVFLNCFELAEVTLYAGPETPTGLPSIVNNIAGNLRALFRPEGPEGPVAAAFRYPEYWEDIEETPAHILLHTFSGQGYHYRQCFRDGRLLAGEYDGVFAQGHGGDEPVYMALLCLDRLRWPWQLGAQAAARYRAFLAQQGGAAAAALIHAEDKAALAALLALQVLDGPALAAAARAAQRAGDAAAAALVADAEYKAHAAAPKRRRRYDFDF